MSAGENWGRVDAMMGGEKKKRVIHDTLTKFGKSELPEK